MKALVRRASDSWTKDYTKNDIKEFTSLAELVKFSSDYGEIIIDGSKNTTSDGEEYDFSVEIYDDYRE